MSWWFRALIEGDHVVIRRLLVAAVLVAILVPVSATAQSAGSRFAEAPSGGAIDPAVAPIAMNDTGTVTVMVEMVGDPVAVVQAKVGRELTNAERQTIKAELRGRQDVAKGQIQALGGQVRSQMQSAYNGMRVDIARNAVPAVAALANVVAVRGVQNFYLNNANSVQLLGVPSVWQNTGVTGDNVKVAIIDTGVDYTHANFGGPGTVEAYEAADANDTDAPDPALFGPGAPRVKGGFDFVGDDYDANDDTSVPVPDPDPLDCNGHGSHVAGTTGGNGVLEDGTTFGGPYDANTFTNNSFRIGPGVAPEVDLYALRVFGCDGSTNVTTEAIDWAVDNDMDVINMSLGSSFGRTDDPTAQASTNAVLAGVVVITSAGNEGPNPYITGSPGTGFGVISTAATDGVASFPGATLTFGGTTLEAINANGADVPAGPYEIVVLPGLGCSVAEYTDAGISADPAAPLQLAVTTRGTCARVARAVFGQQAGADAVVMINNADVFPPFEGQITGNPDTGEQYLVTIPFLGIPSSDGPVLKAADGQQVTLAGGIVLPNPGFGGFASFSSGGPRNGDSGAKPNVAAPGVSIFSTGVGTGNGFAIISGTSMASPFVAGVAALKIEANPTWSASEVAGSISNSADPEGVAGYRLTRAGTGLVDPTQVVGQSVVAFGDSIPTGGGKVRDYSLSFGFADLSTNFRGTRTLTLVNKGTSSATYNLSYAPTTQSRPATVSFSPASVTVAAGGRATVNVTLNVPVATAGTVAAGSGQHSFWEASGNVVLSGPDTLRVPLLLVPRANSKIAANATINPRSGSTTATVTNRNGAVDGSVDFYTWGLSDNDDVNEAQVGGSGYDIRAVGAQSFDFGDDKLIVFAVNSHSRWSNAAPNEFDIPIDTNNDGTDDFVVLAVDSGLVRTGSTDGLTEVFYVDLATGGLFASGFLAASPTDSSTILLPILASDLGMTSSTDFTYSAVSFSLEGPGFDPVNGSAMYNPWDRAIVDGQFGVVAPNTTASVQMTINQAQWQKHKPLGVMVVAIENAAGPGEAILLQASG